jgi:hypothetical protein
MTKKNRSQNIKIIIRNQINSISSPIIMPRKLHSHITNKTMASNYQKTNFITNEVTNIKVVNIFSTMKFIKRLLKTIYLVNSNMDNITDSSMGNSRDNSRDNSRENSMNNSMDNSTHTSKPNRLRANNTRYHTNSPSNPQPPNSVNKARFPYRLICKRI